VAGTKVGTVPFALAFNPDLINDKAFPSHGRGRRFNPYSAHHKKPFISLHFRACLSRNIGKYRQNETRRRRFDSWKIRGLCS
jgi:hypothetical protein